jgi:hypothetical protein
MEAMAEAPPLSRFRIERTVRGVGVDLCDRLTDEVTLVVDQGLSPTGRAGLYLATRLARFGCLDVKLTSGAPVVVEESLAVGLAAEIRAEIGRGAAKVLATMPPGERSRLATRILREVLADSWQE